MFTPLAYTKTFAMAGAALLSITLVPVLMLLFIRGKIMPEKKNPINRFLIWIYRPIIAWVMRWKKLTIIAALVALLRVYPAMHLGSEFMPVLNEGSCCSCRRHCRHCRCQVSGTCCRPRIGY